MHEPDTAGREPDDHQTEGAAGGLSVPQLVPTRPLVRSASRPRPACFVVCHLIFSGTFLSGTAGVQPQGSAAINVYYDFKCRVSSVTDALRSGTGSARPVCPCGVSDRQDPAVATDGSERAQSGREGDTAALTSWYSNLPHCPPDHAREISARRAKSCVGLRAVLGRRRRETYTRPTCARRQVG
jgi:hypothetical protein